MSAATVLCVSRRIERITTTEFSDPNTRMRVLTTAKDEYEKIASRNLIDLGLRKGESPASDTDYSPGDWVYVYQEDINQYTDRTYLPKPSENARVNLGEQTGSWSFKICQLKPVSFEKLEEPDIAKYT